MLDTAWALGAIPARFGGLDGDRVSDYFALARAGAGRAPARDDEVVLDTNYHYLVPELEPGQAWDLRADHWTEPLRAAAELGVETRPVVIGPFSFLKLDGRSGRSTSSTASREVYTELLARLAEAGAGE